MSLGYAAEVTLSGCRLRTGAIIATGDGRGQREQVVWRYPQQFANAGQGVEVRLCLTALILPVRVGLKVENARELLRRLIARLFAGFTEALAKRPHDRFVSSFCHGAAWWPRLLISARTL